MAHSSIASDPGNMSRSSTPLGLEEIPSSGVTITTYYSAGSAPEILSIQSGKGTFDYDRHDESTSKLEKRLMELKYSDPGKRRRRKKTRKIRRK